MTMKTRQIILSIMAGTMMSTSAMAQEVVMRRPIPIQPRGNAVDCTVTNTCPDQTDIIQGYGYVLQCPLDPACYLVQYVEEEDDIIETTVDSSLCQVNQGAAVNDFLNAWGYAGGGPNFDEEEMCNNPTTAYLWGGYCSSTTPTYYCVGVSESVNSIIPHAASSCENYVPRPEHAALIQTWAINGLVTNAEKVANPIDCGGDNSDPDPDPGPDEEPDGFGEPDDMDAGILPQEGTLSWEVGAWQGNATCGEMGTLSRSVRCVERRTSRPPVVMNGREDVYQVSFSEDYAEMRTNALATESDQIEAENALLRDDDIADIFNIQSSGFTNRYVTLEACVQTLGTPPAAVYTGTHANCDYDLEVANDGEWTHPTGGDPTCSADAVFRPEYQCIDSSTGMEVHIAYCQENLNTGGTRNTQATQAVYGNFEGCTANWVESTNIVGCYKDLDITSGNGPIKLLQTGSSCIRSDGTPLNGIDAQACAGDQPPTQLSNGGSCYVNFIYDNWNGVCWGNYPLGESLDFSDFEDTRTVVFEGTLGQGGAAACAAAGSTCCQERYNHTDGVVETVGSSTKMATFGTQIYYDDPTSIETLYARYEIRPDGTRVNDESSKYYRAFGAKRYSTVAGSDIYYTLYPPQ